MNIFKVLTAFCNKNIWLSLCNIYKNPKTKIKFGNSIDK